MLYIITHVPPAPPPPPPPPPVPALFGRVPAAPADPAIPATDIPLVVVKFKAPPHSIIKTPPPAPPAPPAALLPVFPLSYATPPLPPLAPPAPVDTTNTLPSALPNGIKLYACAEAALPAVPAAPPAFPFTPPAPPALPAFGFVVNKLFSPAVLADAPMPDASIIGVADDVSVTFPCDFKTITVPFVPLFENANAPVPVMLIDE